MSAKKFKLGSIEQETAACRKAFKGVKPGAFVLHCHHDALGELLTEDAENRILFILSSKAEHEQSLRLRLFRPVPESRLRKFRKAEAEWRKADAEWEKMYVEAEWRKTATELVRLVHSKVCYPNCPWDGETIFSADEQERAK